MFTKRYFKKLILKKVVAVKGPVTFAEQDIRILKNKASQDNQSEKSLSRALPNQQTRNLPQEGANLGTKVAPFVTPALAAGSTVPIDGTLDVFAVKPPIPTPFILNPPVSDSDLMGPLKIDLFSLNPISNITQFDTSVENAGKWLDLINNQLQSGAITQETYSSELNQIQQYLNALTDRFPEYATTKLFPEIADVKNALKANGVTIQDDQATITNNAATVTRNENKIQELLPQTERILHPDNPDVPQINTLRADILGHEQTMLDNQHIIDANKSLIATLNPQTDSARIAELTAQIDQLTHANQTIQADITGHKEALYALDQKEYELIGYEQQNLELNHQADDAQTQLATMLSDNDKLHIKLAALQQHTYELSKPTTLTYSTTDHLSADDFTSKNNELFESLLKRQENIHLEIEHSRYADSDLWSYDTEANRIRYEMEQLIAQNPNEAHAWIDSQTTATLNQLNANAANITNIDTQISHLNPTTDAAQIAQLQAQRALLVDQGEMLSIRRAELDGINIRLHDGLLNHAELSTAEIAGSMAQGIGITTAVIFGGAVIGPFIGAVFGKVIGAVAHFFKCLFTGKWQKMRSTPFVIPKIKATAIAACIGGFIGGAIKGGLLGVMGGPGGIIAGVILGGLLGAVAGFAGGALGAWLLKNLVTWWRNYKRRSKIQIDNKPVEIVKPKINAEKLV